MPGSTRGSALPEAGRTPLLEVQDLSVTFRTEEGLVRAVDSVSLSVLPGEVVGIVGESGSGKTVSMLAVMRLIRDPNAVIEGHVFHRGRDLLQLSKSEIRSVRGAEIAMVFQDPMTSLTPVYTVGWQIAEQVRAHEPMSASRARARAVELLAEVGISNPERRADDFPHQFSGGMRQRVMIAMALSCNPSLLIADEPTTALDVTIQAQILDLLRRLVEDRETALILITHDLGVVAGMCERVNVMYAGMFMETGSADQLFSRPRHPYTLGLLQSVPRLDAERKTKLQPIEGSPRDMLRAPQACPFQPRCRFEVEQSSLEVPPLRELEPGHMVACFNPVPVEEWQRSRAAAVG